MNNAISAASTLAAVGDERVNFIVDFLLPRIRLDNSQQDALSTDYEGQVCQSHTDGEGGGGGVGWRGMGAGGRGNAQVSQSVTHRYGTRGGDGSEGATMPRSVIYRDTEVVTLCLYTNDLCNY